MKKLLFIAAMLISSVSWSQLTTTNPDTVCYQTTALSTCPAGLINNAISVAYTSASGCSATPVTLNVLIYQVVPVITPVGPFCASDPCVTLAATPAGGTWSGAGVTGNQFCPGVTNSLITYTYTNGGCTFTAQTGAQVNPTPVLSPIQHN